MDVNEALYIAKNNWAFRDNTLNEAFAVLNSANTGQAADAAHKIAATLRAREDAEDLDR